LIVLISCRALKKQVLEYYCKNTVKTLDREARWYARGVSEAIYK